MPFCWRSSARREPDPPTPSTDGRVVYAVGDIHGCAELLSALLRAIARDAADLAPAQPPALVFIGDYVDRGDDSRGVIDQVIALQGGAFEVRALKGNHEEMLLAFLQDAGAGPTWAQFGGLKTLASYGVAPPAMRSQGEAWEAARQALGAALPAGHRAFLANLELWASFGDHVFVHAGVRSGTPIERQRERDLLWIRDAFLRSKAPFPAIVVHGHTPQDEPTLGPRRIGIDTGAYATGVLTAVRLQGAERKVIQARAGALKRT